MSAEQLAAELDRAPSEVRAALLDVLYELDACIDPAAATAWSSFGRWMVRAYDTVADESTLAQLRDLDRQHSLVFLPSHRSYLDVWTFPLLTESRGINSAFSLGGANLNFFPFGTFASRTGMIFIRRSAADDPLYRLALRTYVGAVLRDGTNLMWSIEGGRTRTGKLRPPRYGLLRYLIDAVEAIDGPELYLVPVSIVYDQLHEVSMMTAEALGVAKRQEDVRWLVRLIHQQRERLGNVYIDFGKPIALRERLAAERTADPAVGDTGHRVERIALTVCHHINRATPVTQTAAVTFALLAGDRALSLGEIEQRIAPIERYARRRSWAVAGGGSLTDRNAITRTLRQLVDSGVASVYDQGAETVWSIAPGQHLVAAFYRNTTIHMFVNRAIAEIALLAASRNVTVERPTVAVDSLREYALDIALGLRELLKFEFFFAERGEFVQELGTEMSLIDPQWSQRTANIDGTDQLAAWLGEARPHVAHLVLRPFLEAYLVVADLLAERSTEPDSDDAFLDECLRVGRQLVLQRRVVSEESLSLELFRNALRLARHRGLITADDSSASAHLSDRRRVFAEQVRELTGLVNAIGVMSTEASTDATHRASSKARIVTAGKDLP